MDQILLIVLGSIVTTGSVAGLGVAVWIRPPKWAAQIVNRAKRIRSAEADITFEERLERMKKRAVEAPKKQKRSRTKEQDAFSVVQWKSLLQDARLGATKRQLAEASKETTRLVRQHSALFSGRSAMRDAVDHAQEQLRYDRQKLEVLEAKHDRLLESQRRLEEYERKLRDGVSSESSGSYTASSYEPGDVKTLVEINQPSPGRIVGGRIDLSGIYADTIFNSDPHAVNEAEKNRRGLKAETSIVGAPRHMDCTGRGPTTPSELMARSIMEFDSREDERAAFIEKVKEAAELARKAKDEADAAMFRVSEDDFAGLLSELSKEPVEKRDSYDDLGDDEAESLENEIVGEPAEWVDDLIAEQWPTMSAELRKKVADEWASLGLESVVR